MDWLHFLVSTKQLHGLEIGLELEFCSRIEAERPAERRSEAFLGLRHHVNGEYCRMRTGFLFPLLRLIGIARVLVSALLFLVALPMLALGLQPPLLLFPVIQGRSGKSNIEISSSQIIRARIVLFCLQSLLEPFDRIRSERLDRKEGTGRRSARGFRAILLEKREGRLNTDNTGHAWTAFSACAEGSQPDDLARCVEQRPAGTAWINVDIRHDGVQFDLADDAGGDDLIQAEGAADREHPLAFLNR